MPAHKKFLVVLLIALAIFLFSSKIIFAQNLLQNPGFEEGDSGWNKYGSTQLRIVDNTLNGTKAGALTSDKTGAKYIYQDFETFEGEEFQLSGWVFWNDSSIANAKLRVEWYDSSSTRVGLDEVSLVSKGSDWQYLMMSIKAPPSSKTARVEAYTYLNQASPSNPVLFDDLIFERGTLPGLTPTLTLTPTPTPTKIPTPTTSPPAIKDYDNIFISEFMAYPESDNEWVELYNDNNFEVNLSGWYIDDFANGGSAPKGISGIITAKGYKQFFLSNAFLNNDGDDVRLLNGNQNEKDKTSFDSSTEGKSWSKDQDGDWCQVDPTPNSSNPNCPTETSSTVSTPTPTSEPQTPTPTKKMTPTPEVTGLVATESGEILGEESSPAGFYLLETPAPTIEASASSSKSQLLPKIFIVLGLVVLFGVAFWLWYTRLRSV